MIKATIWTAMGVAMTAFVGMWMTGSWTVGGQLALINSAIGLICYVLYERIWAVISWGRLDG